MNVLILGDGNFSFSLALAKLIQSNSPIICSYLSIPTTLNSKLTLYCSSIDSSTQLYKKYSDCYDIIQKLLNFNFVHVLHNVNAWQLESQFSNLQFDLVIWNHPHVGREDFNLHSFLIAHFFHSCKTVLKSNGIIKLTLVQGQETRWKLYENCTKNGLFIKDMIEFDETLFEGYIVKRNKHGGSFKNLHTKRHGDSAMISCEYMLTTTPNEFDFKMFNEQLNRIFGSGKGLTLKGLKNADLGMERHLKDARNEYSCEFCLKLFPTNRSWKCHVYTVHILKKFGHNWEPNRVPMVKCSQCSKMLHDKEGLQQHFIAKHVAIDFEMLEIDSNNPINHTLSEYHYIPCNICGQSRLNTPDGYRIHMQSLLPCVELEMECPICKRNNKNIKFIEFRALEQHFRFCLEQSKSLHIS